MQFDRLQQNIYIYLLHRYLQMKYRSDFLTNRKLQRLINNLKDLNIINEKMGTISRDVHIEGLQFPPLFQEIFDRK